jgi:bifunctional N-acetylglucosamine-1-phosphate-uridyltransferase/glucosamine-1-phosphate-acetyltransferase GlmU-like protein
VLAAGKGTRMKSELPKVLHHAAGLPLIDHVLRTAASLRPASIVVGSRGEPAQEVSERAARPCLALQEPQLGTGHALLVQPRLGDARG